MTPMEWIVAAPIILGAVEAIIGTLPNDWVPYRSRILRLLKGLIKIADEL